MAASKERLSGRHKRKQRDGEFQEEEEEALEGFPENLLEETIPARKEKRRKRTDKPALEDLQVEMSNLEKRENKRSKKHRKIAEAAADDKRSLIVDGGVSNNEHTKHGHQEEDNAKSSEKSAEALVTKVPQDVGSNERGKTKTKKKKKWDRWGQPVTDANDRQDTKVCLEDDAQQPHPNMNDKQWHKDEYDLKKVCVGGMPYDTTEDGITNFFSQCGTIAEVNCIKFADTKRFKGLAFITFKTEAAAKKALALDGADMGGRFIKIEQVKQKDRITRDPPKKTQGCLSVYVGNLPWDVQQPDVKRFFKGCQINAVRLAYDKATGNFRGYGHVDFADDDSLEKGIKLDQKKLQGRPVKVSYAVPAKH